MLAQPLVLALGWALIHFIWQGTLVALLLAGVLRVWREQSTNVRYVAACAALLLMFLLPPVTLAIISGSVPDEAGGGLPSVIAAQPESQPMPVERASFLALIRADNGVAASQAWPARFVSWLPWLILFWLAGVVCFSLRLIGGWLYTRRLMCHGTRPLAAQWQQRLRRLCLQLRVSHPVRLVESALVKVPTAIGWLRPVILLPVGALAGLTPQQLEAIIAHELAHIRRHDYLINLLQAVIETLLFYHPAVWWVSRRIRQEREHCCDDLAVAVCGDALTYARALLEMEQLRAATPQLAVAANGGMLMNRIQRLVGAPAPPTNRFTGLVASLIVLTTIVSVGVGAQIMLPAFNSENADQQLVSVREREAGKSNASADTAGQPVRLTQAERAAEALLPALQATSWEVRKAAVERSAQLRVRRAVEPLKQALQDASEQVRKKAAEALGLLKQSSGDSAPSAPNQAINQQAVIAENLQALHSSTPMVRAAAACSLGRLGAVEAIPALINLLGDDTPIQSVKCWDSGNWSPALDTLKQASPGEQAAIALAALSLPAVEPLIAALGNAHPSVRRNAAWAIGEVTGVSTTGRSAAVDPLIVALGDADSWVRVAAAFSLGELRPRRATEALLTALLDTEWNVREMAARALGELKARAGVESLTARLLEDENERVRRKAAWALGEIKDAQALEALTTALTDRDQRVRATAKWAISEIRD